MPRLDGTERNITAKLQYCTGRRPLRRPIMRQQATSLSLLGLMYCQGKSRGNRNVWLSRMICAGTCRSNKSAKFINDTLYRVNLAKRNRRTRLQESRPRAERYALSGQKLCAFFHRTESCVRYISVICDLSRVCPQYSYRERYSKHNNSLRNSSICINGEEQGSVTSLSTKTKVRSRRGISSGYEFLHK